MITSKNNALVKDLASLKEKKFRDEKGEYLVEGFKMVREAFLAGKNVVALVGTESGISELGTEKICPGFKNVAVVSEDVLSRISDCKTPQGVVCAIKKEVYSAEKPSGVSVLLDGVSDPGNMGTIIRTAAAVGVKDLYLANCCDPFSPKVVRSSMSGIYSVKLHFIDRSEIGEVFSSVELIAADMGGENVFGYKPQGDFALPSATKPTGSAKKQSEPPIKSRAYP